MSNRPDSIGWEPTDPNAIEAPDATKRATGWQFQEPPSHQIFNWFWRKVGRWLDFLDARNRPYTSIIEAMAEAGEGDVFAVSGVGTGADFDSRTHPLDGFEINNNDSGVWQVRTDGDVIVLLGSVDDPDGDNVVCLGHEGKRWGASIGSVDPGVANVAFGPSRVYIANNEGGDCVIRAFGKEDGDEVWETSVDEELTGNPSSVIPFARMTVSVTRTSGGSVVDDVYLAVGDQVYWLSGSSGTDNGNVTAPEDTLGVFFACGRVIVIHEMTASDEPITTYSLVLGDSASFALPDDYGSAAEPTLADTQSGILLGTDKAMEDARTARIVVRDDVLRVIDSDVQSDADLIVGSVIGGIGLAHRRCDGRYIYGLGPLDTTTGTYTSSLTDTSTGGRYTTLLSDSFSGVESDGAHVYVATTAFGNTILRCRPATTRLRRFVCTRLEDGGATTNGREVRNNRFFHAID